MCTPRDVSYRSEHLDVVCTKHVTRRTRQSAGWAACVGTYAIFWHAPRVSLSPKRQSAHICAILIACCTTLEHHVVTEAARDDSVDDSGSIGGASPGDDDANMHRQALKHSRADASGSLPETLSQGGAHAQCIFRWRGRCSSHRAVVLYVVFVARGREPAALQSRLARSSLLLDLEPVKLQTIGLMHPALTSLAPVKREAGV